MEKILPRYFRDSVEQRLDAAASSSETVDLQEVFLELTTTLMGVMAYDVSSHGKNYANPSILLLDLRG